MSGLPIAPPSFGHQKGRHPVITLLTGYLEQVCPDELAKAVKAACDAFPNLTKDLKVHDEDSFLLFASNLLRWTPTENADGTYIYNVLCLFYYVFDRGELRKLQTPIHPNQVSEELTWLSSWIVVFAQLVGQFLDTAASITPETLDTFKKSKKYQYEEAVVPEGGFKTFDDFFCRHLKTGTRPVSESSNDKVIVYPADCKYDNSLENQSIVRIESDDTITIKGLKWTIASLLNGTDFAKDFEGGIWMHAYLNTYNYHRQRAPVSGKVIVAKNIQGLAYLEVDADGYPVRRMLGSGEPRMPDSAGYQFLQTRGVIVIENPTLGKVAVLPIGMAMICSVELAVKVGDEVIKGETEISSFHFGGSDIICVFQPKAGLTDKDFVATSGDYSKMGSVLAKAP